MNEQQLVYFRKLAESQNLSKTAAELIISPPALSATIRRLEEELDCRLFDRIGHSIRLNENGEIFLHCANDVLATLDRAREDLAIAKQRADLHLTVGLSSPLICHDALHAFVKQYPEIQLTHRLLRIDQLSSPSLKHEVDFVIASKDDVPDGDWEGTLMNEKNPIMLAVYPSHPFAKRESVSLEEISSERFIAIPRDYCFRRFTDRAFEEQGIEPNIILECDFALRGAMLDAQHGILVTSAGTKNKIFSPNTVFVPLADFEINYPWYIFRRKKPLKTTAAELFNDFMISFYMQNKNERNDERQTTFCQSGSET